MKKFNSTPEGTHCGNAGPAAVRLYSRAIEIENEVEEEEIVDRLPVKDLLAYPHRRIKNAKARRLRTHGEYQWVRAELVRLLGFDPFNPPAR